LLLEAGLKEVIAATTDDTVCALEPCNHGAPTKFWRLEEVFTDSSRSLFVVIAWPEGVHVGRIDRPISRNHMD
jgi:hypothetical protein